MQGGGKDQRHRGNQVTSQASQRQRQRGLSVGRESCPEDRAPRASTASFGETVLRGGNKEQTDRKGEREGTSWDMVGEKPHPPKVQQYGGTGVCPVSTCCPRSLPRDATACQRHTTGLCSKFHRYSGSDLEGCQYRASKPWAWAHCLFFLQPHSPSLASPPPHSPSN